MVAIRNSKTVKKGDLVKLQQLQAEWFAKKKIELEELDPLALQSVRLFPRSYLAPVIYTCGFLL